MNVLRDAAMLELQRSNVNVLEVTLRQTRDRFNAGEVTRTDVAQAESRLAAGRSQLAVAESNYITVAGALPQVIGVPAPARLAPATPVDRLVPAHLPGAIARGRTEHPDHHDGDVQRRRRGAAGQDRRGRALSDPATRSATCSKSYGSTNSLAVLENLSASIGAQLSVPLYQGGAEYAAIRQAKETLGQRRLDLDTARDQVQSHGDPGLGPARSRQGQISATQAQVAAAEIALNGVREEARVGQRTTLDVLNAQQELVNARVALVTAQRDRVVASYTVLAAVGRLSPQILGLGHPGLRSDDPLPSGPRRLGRRAHAGRQVTHYGNVRLRNCRLAASFDMPILPFEFARDTS